MSLEIFGNNRFSIIIIFFLGGEGKENDGCYGFIVYLWLLFFFLFQR